MFPLAVMHREEGVMHSGRAQFSKKEGILKKGVKREDRTTFSTKKSIAEENLFNRNVVI